MRVDEEKTNRGGRATVSTRQTGPAISRGRAALEEASAEKDLQPSDAAAVTGPGGLWMSLSRPDWPALVSLRAAAPAEQHSALVPTRQDTSLQQKKI